MPVVADFITFSDVSFDLELGGTSSQTLNENITEQPRLGEGALLLWNVRREGTGSVSYNIRVNNGNARSFTVSETNWHSVHEVIQTNDLNQGDNNIFITVTGGTGRLSVGDVTILYRLDS